MDARSRVERRWMAGVFGVGAIVLIAEGLHWIEQGASYVVAATLMTCFWPLSRAWKGSQGLGLRPAVVWAFVAVSLAMAGQIAGCWESPDSGRPIAGHWVYLASLATIASLLSTFNARSPGGVAWAILMTLLIVVMLVPWLEASSLGGDRNAMDRLSLDMPWSLFFGVLAFAGTTNYFRTRFGWSAYFGGLFLAFELWGLIWTSGELWKRATIWSLGPWFLAIGIWSAYFASKTAISANPGLPRLWFWFRDYWGVVWALRIMDRFNRAAETASWPVRLTWQGPILTEETISNEARAAAEATFRALLRRFATATRIALAAKGVDSRACEPDGR